MNNNITYNEFLLSKVNVAEKTGIKVSDSSFNKFLKPFQKFCVKTALQKGQFALFEDCGLGKTLQELDWSNHVSKHTNRPVLNLAPLAVVGQTIDEGKKFGIEVKEAENIILDNNGIYITNYEQLENIPPDIIENLGGVVIDESSILKNFEGAYRNLIIKLFRHTPFKLCGTATPSPNDPMELGNHAEFLGVMSRSEMLATYFVHDGGETAKWRLKGHAMNSFWQWVSSWSLMFSKPSDIGFDDTGYILPELNFIEKQILTPQREGKLFNDVAVSASNFHHEVRLTKTERLSEIVEIVNNSNENFIVWVEQNQDGDYLQKMIPNAVQVSGSNTDLFKKEKLLGFAKSAFRVLITKPKIASFGMNYQNCHNMIFASPDFSFEKMYQAIRRELRYGQQYPVNAYIITTDTMQNVIAAFKEKQKQHKEMQLQMITHTKNLYGKYSEAA